MDQDTRNETFVLLPPLEGVNKSFGLTKGHQDLASCHILTGRPFFLGEGDGDNLQEPAQPGKQQDQSPSGAAAEQVVGQSQGLPTAPSTPAHPHLFKPEALRL